MYRRFLDSEQVSIKLTWFNLQNPQMTISKAAEPNDPGYLMAQTSCPAPFHDTPMFLPWDGDNELVFTVPYQGEAHDVRIVFSVAKPESRKMVDGKDPGSLP